MIIILQKNTQDKELRNLLGVGEEVRLDVDDNNVKVPFIMETKIVALKYLTVKKGWWRVDFHPGHKDMNNSPGISEPRFSNH